MKQIVANMRVSLCIHDHIARADGFAEERSHKKGGLARRPQRRRFQKTHDANCDISVAVDQCAANCLDEA